MRKFDSDYEDDPILKELHEVRRQILAEYGGDVSAMIKDICAMRIPGVKYVETPRYANRIRPIPFRYSDESTAEVNAPVVAEADAATYGGTSQLRNSGTSEL